MNASNERLTQTDPRLERWINLGMRAEFPFITIGSPVFEIGLETYEAAEATFHVQDEMYSEQQDGWQEAVQAHSIASKKAELFRMVSGSLHAAINRRPTGAQLDGATYVLAIAEACQHPATIVEVATHYDDQQKADLRGFIERLAFEYWADDSHFRQPAAN